MSTLSFNLLAFLMVLHLDLKMYSHSLVYQIVNGSLDNSWKSNFTLFANEFKGIILYCFDFQNNQFSIKLSIVNESQKIIRIKFNYVTKDIPLFNLCGCNLCNNHRMVFHIQSNKNVLNISCNNYYSESLPLNVNDNQKNHEGIDKLYPLPIEMANVSDSMYFMIGNIGPYTTVNNTIQPPIKNDQMIGCVDSFYYNDMFVSLLNIGDKVMPSCAITCSKNPCNGGICRQISQDNVTCDCSNVALNGRYCNNELIYYHRGRDTSFSAKKDATNIYLKMTWKTIISRTYCLMEIIDEYRGLNKSLLLDSSSLGINNNLFTNFIIINITDKYSYIKINNNKNQSKIDFTTSTNIKINIGFSERGSTCAVFEGVYDLQYDLHNLRNIQGGISNHYIGQMRSISTDNSKQPSQSNLSSRVLRLEIVVAILSLLLIALVIMHCRRNIFRCILYLSQYIRPNNGDPSNDCNPIDTASNSGNVVREMIHERPKSSMYYEKIDYMCNNQLTDVYDYMPMSHSNNTNAVPRTPSKNVYLTMKRPSTVNPIINNSL